MFLKTGRDTKFLSDLTEIFIFVRKKYSREGGEKVIISGKDLVERLAMVAPLSPEGLDRVSELINEGKIVISPFPDISGILKVFSLDFEIGKIKIPESPGMFKEICVDFSRPETLKENFEIYDKEKIFLHPKDFLRIETRQFLGIPTNLLAQVTIKRELAKYGLGIIGEPVYLSPGFIGRVEVDVNNHGNRPIALSQGLAIFQVMFEQLTSRT